MQGSLGDEKFELILKDTLSRTVDWLKFAETKNAALLTFCSAWLLAMGGLAFSGREIGNHTEVALGVSALLLVFAIVCAIRSLVPRIPTFSAIAPTHRFNTLFYGDIADLDKQYFNHTKYLYSTPANYQRDLCDQIVVNSKIARDKFRMFKYGSWFATLSLLTFVAINYASILLSFVPRP